MVKNLPANAGDAGDSGSIPGSGRSPGGGNGNHSSILAWGILQTEEPGGLQSIGVAKKSDTTERLNNNNFMITTTGHILKVTKPRELAISFSEIKS